MVVRGGSQSYCVGPGGAGYQSDAIAVGQSPLSIASTSDDVVVLPPGYVSSFRDQPRFASTSVVVGVGHPGDEPDPLAALRRADVGSGETIPPRIVPERGQISENFSEGTSVADGKQPWDVFQHDVRGSKLAQNSSELGPEPPLVTLSTARSRCRPRLARESSSDDIDSLEVVSADASDISESSGSGEVPGKDC